MGPPSTKPRNRRHRSELSRQKARQAAEQKRRQLNADIEALARIREERERQRAGLASGSAGTRSNAHEPETPEVRLPNACANTDGLPNDGMAQHTPNNHLIQVNMSFDPAFASMPVDTLTPHILEAARQWDESEAAQGPQPLLPGRTVQSN
jgi:hypothetical protein